MLFVILVYFLGIIDIIVLPFNGMFTGWLGMQGWVFCTKPDFLYVVGSLMLGKFLMVLNGSKRCEYKHLLGIIILFKKRRLSRRLQVNKLDLKNLILLLNKH